MPQDDREALVSQIAGLRAQLEELRGEKKDLEMMLEMTTEHSDAVEEELHDKAEEALRESERRLRMIVEATPTPVLIFTIGDRRVVFANGKAGPALGLGGEDVLGRDMTAFFHDGENPQSLPPVLAAARELDRQELRLHQADGTLQWVELSARPLELNDEPALLCAFHDITERKRRFEASRRFVPSEFLTFFHKDSIVDLELGDFISKEMTVMFSDVRSFTTISEGMTPQQNFDFINAYLERVSPIVREHDGFIVKYLGDGMMAVFPRSVDDAVRAGVEKLTRVNAYNAERALKGYLPVKVGIGVHTGPMMVGMVGEENRMQGDAFSDDVNLTSRIEGLTKFYDASLIVSAESHARLADPGRYQVRFLDKVQVKGRTSAVRLYEIFDGDEPRLRKLKEQTREILAEAQELYYARQFRAAQVELFKALQVNPDDKLAWHFLVEASKWLEQDVGEDWDGVTVMTRK